MQISRLFEIVYLLLRREKMSAKELAAHFEVSTRTIYRDIDVLSGAGIPVYATKGRGGGIQLLPGFVLNTSLLSSSEQNDILAALQSLSAVQVPDVDSVLDKLGGLFRQDTPRWVAVDFSDWSAQAGQKFEAIKTGILQKRALSFTYFNAANQKALRRAEPLQLWFKHRAWYLRAFCLQKNAMRLFKLNRMRDVVLTDAPCGHALPPEEETQDAVQAPPLSGQPLRLNIAASSAYRVYDEFDEEQIVPNEDGSFTVEMPFIDDEWIYGYVLSFGEEAHVLGPPAFRDTMRKKIEALLQLYS